MIRYESVHLLDKHDSVVDRKAIRIWLRKHALSTRSTRVHEYTESTNWFYKTTKRTSNPDSIVTVASRTLARKHELSNMSCEFS